jgi:hypothetical protein
MWAGTTLGIFNSHETSQCSNLERPDMLKDVVIAV